jgi:hypothetical protein
MGPVKVRRSPREGLATVLLFVGPLRDRYVSLLGDLAFGMNGFHGPS